MTQSRRKEAIAYEMGYYVDESGAVFNPKGMRLKVSSKDNKRYPQVTVKIEGKKYCVRMHRLAAYCFYGDAIYEDGIVVRHLNDIKTDVSKSNIALGTQLDNMNDVSEEVWAISAKKKRKYAIENEVKPPRVFKIPDSEVPSILERLDNGESQRSVAKFYGVHPSTIGYIHTNRRFTYGENKCS